MKLIEKDKFNVIELTGRVIMSNSDDVKKQIKNMVKDKREKKLIIDLEKVDFLDSTGIGVLISIYKYMRENEGQLILCSPSKTVKRIIDITKLDMIMDVFPDLNTAENQ